MHKVFIDTDIFLDLLSERHPFYKNAAEIFSLIDTGQIIGYTSPIVFANLHYILSKQLTKSYAIASLKKLRSMVKIVSVSEKDIDLSLESSFSDFEDAIQHFSAISADIPFIITRNIKDYKKATITVCTPDDYLTMWSSKN